MTEQPIIPPTVGSSNLQRMISDLSAKVAYLERKINPIWIDHTASLSMPNVNKSVGYARYALIGNTLIYQGGIIITAGAVIGQVLIDLPTGLNWGPGAAYTISIGWGDLAPWIGKVRGIRSGVSWYEGDIVPYSMKSGGTPARASVWNVGTSGPADGSSSGAVWTGTNPVTWQANDRWGFTFMAEVVQV